MRTLLLPALFLISLSALHAAPPDLSHIQSRKDLDALIAASPDTPLKQALAEHASAILTAASQYPHVAAVVKTIESAPGSFRKVNVTPDSLKIAGGGEIQIFDTLTQVSTGIVNGKPHVYRGASEDPYDAAFIEHLGNIPALESVKIVATKIQDPWLVPLLKLKNLKHLSIEGLAAGLPGRPTLGDPSLERLEQLTQFEQLTSLDIVSFSSATDAGLERLAGLKNLESFTFLGTSVKGHALAKFKGWTKLKSINFHSNSLDDQGFGYVCENFPNLRFIKLWHSQLLTDASAESLGKLRNLTGIEISCRKATPALLKHLPQVPLEYAALEYGVNTPASDAIATMKSIPTLRRLKLGGVLPEVDLAALAGMTQLQELSIHVQDLPDELLTQLKAFSFLKSLTLSARPNGISEEKKEKLKAILPKVDVKCLP